MIPITSDIQTKLTPQLMNKGMKPICNSPPSKKQLPRQVNTTSIYTTPKWYWPAVNCKINHSLQCNDTLICSWDRWINSGSLDLSSFGLWSETGLQLCVGWILRAFSSHHELSAGVGRIWLSFHFAHYALDWIQMHLFTSSEAAWQIRVAWPLTGFTLVSTAVTVRLFKPEAMCVYTSDYVFTIPRQNLWVWVLTLPSTPICKHMKLNEVWYSFADRQWTFSNLNKARSGHTKKKHQLFI